MSSEASSSTPTRAGNSGPRRAEDGHSGSSSSSMRGVVIPPRSASLQTQAGGVTSGGVQSGDGHIAGEGGTGGQGRLSRSGGIEEGMADLALGSDNHHGQQAASGSSSSKTSDRQSGSAGGEEGSRMLQNLERERNEMVQSIAEEARGRTVKLSEDGEEVFRRGGLGDKVGKRGEVEVRTEWLEPVVHETIRKVEHTEVTEVIDREVHRHHIFPLIQPIHDPSLPPEILETRHRIFNPSRGTWHEVIGDKAAIAILGAEAFYNGKKEKRLYRLASPFPGTGTGSASDELLESELFDMRGTNTNDVPASTAPLTPDQIASRRQNPKPRFEARVIERDGTDGVMSDWRTSGGGDADAATDAGGGQTGNYQASTGGSERDPGYMIGEVTDSMGERTATVAI